MNKDVRKLVTALERIPEVDVQPAGSGHLVVTKAGQFVTTLPTTPSDNRWERNTMATLRRFGITPASRPEKLSRPPRSLPPKELVAQLRAIRDERRITEFSRFMQQLGEIRGMRTYKTVESAASSLQAITAGKTTRPQTWSWQLISEALAEWRKQATRPAEEEPPVTPKATVEAPAPGLRLVVNLGRLTERLAEFGIELHVEEES